ncbi:classical arabinogalactan protein 4 [Stenotrophomonas sp.]|uniref:classical arabinogalactan protein 4 n=1 Tax=Stenotrophomonas sp. TaxID=69392 RepID=UPI002FC847E4
MSRHLRCAAALALLLPAVAVAQIGPPPDPTATRAAPVSQPAPAPLPAPVRSEPADGPAAQRASNRQVEQRLARPPIQAQGTGPAQPIQGPAVQTKVYDRNGRIIPGAQKVGPNRVLDTRTGKYYDAIPSGDGQQIKP